MKTDNPFTLMFEILSALEDKTETPHAPSFIFEYEDPIEISVYPGHSGICYKWENVWLLIAEGNKCCFLDKETGKLSDVVWESERYGRPECDKYLKRKPIFEEDEAKINTKPDTKPDITQEPEPISVEELKKAILPATITFEPDEVITLNKVFIVSWFNLKVCLVVDRFTKETHFVYRGADVKCVKDIFDGGTVSNLVSLLNREKNHK